MNVTKVSFIRCTSHLTPTITITITIKHELKWCWQDKQATLLHSHLAQVMVLYCC